MQTPGAGSPWIQQAFRSKLVSRKVHKQVRSHRCKKSVDGGGQTHAQLIRLCLEVNGNARKMMSRSKTFVMLTHTMPTTCRCESALPVSQDICSSPNLVNANPFLSN